MFPDTGGERRGGREKKAERYGGDRRDGGGGRGRARVRGEKEGE